MVMFLVFEAIIERDYRESQMNNFGISEKGHLRLRIFSLPS